MREMSRTKVPVAVLGGVRTPYVKPGENFRELSNLELGSLVGREALYRVEVPPHWVDESIWAQGEGIGDGGMAHRISTGAGILEDRPAFTVVQGGCAGLQAVALAYEKIASGCAQVVLVAGGESVSQMPWVCHPSWVEFFRFRSSISFWGRIRRWLFFNFSHLRPLELMEVYRREALRLAERLAREFGISCEEQDRFTLRSHRFYMKAREARKVAGELMPVYLAPRFDKVVDRDTFPIESVSQDAIELLRHVEVREGGGVTSGSVAPLVDGACALVLANGDWARAEGIVPLGYIRSYAFCGVSQRAEGLGGAVAAHLSLQKLSMSLKDMELFEIYEGSAALVLALQLAFSSQRFAHEVLGRSQSLGEVVSHRLNPNGGALALGDCRGGSGLQMLLSLLGELRSQDLEWGCVVVSSGLREGGGVVVQR
ncbi:MAG: hypothetical protein D6805_06445 [Planctomycetota bacterium]|nr:MAG: hypothetical protein D6805_06445 [Planctomycetota bacterium]